MKRIENHPFFCLPSANFGFGGIADVGLCSRNPMEKFVLLVIQLAPDGFDQTMDSEIGFSPQLKLVQMVIFRFGVSAILEVKQ